jgi:hypothetical protein
VSGGTPLLSRISISPFVAAVAVAAVVAFVLAFVLGGATAAGSPAGPAVRPLHAAGGGLNLPHLSQAAPLPGLAQPASPAVRLPPASRSSSRTPVVIVGSG